MGAQRIADVEMASVRPSLGGVEGVVGLGADDVVVSVKGDNSGEGSARVRLRISTTRLPSSTA